jgi:peptidoglycan/xylan/chitin deacetylase (PgdA/CDA1 family)
MTSSRPLASLSLDLDNKWSYMKTHGDSGWEAYPTYLPLVVPRVLDVLRRRGLTITFFIVGQDAERAENRPALRSIAEARHEIGNHSFKHEPWLHLYSEQEISDELRHAEDAIESATGERPRGFRGPGFSLSPAVLRVLARSGYAYDCSTFPTFLGPLARMYYFMTARLTPQQKQERKVLFGTLKEGFRPLNPYAWKTEGRLLPEIPVTTFPGLRIPFHVSYLLYLSRFIPGLALAYFRAALRSCRATGTAPSLLLHPLDFLGGDDVPELAFFPAMNLPGRRKVEFVEEVLDIYARWFHVLPMREHVAAEQARRPLPVLDPETGNRPASLAGPNTGVASRVR